MDKIMMDRDQFDWLKSLAERGIQVALQEQDIPMPGSEDEKQWLDCRAMLAQFNSEPEPKTVVVFNNQ